MKNQTLSLRTKIVDCLTKPTLKTYCPPFLTQGTITMLYAPRGIGKSHFAFNLALSVAGGSNWVGEKCEQAKVLYIDGEMGADSWIRRLPQNQVFTPNITDNLDLMNPENFKNNMIPSLGWKSNFKFWMETLEKYDVIILDNYLTTVYPETSKDTDLSLWYDFLKILLNLKVKRKAVMIVHHTSKSGVQYGSVLKENQMNTIIRLRQFPEQKLENGLTWEVKIEKDRDNVFEKEVEFILDIVFTNNEVFTNKQSIKKRREDYISNCIRAGMNKSEIAQSLGLEGFMLSESYNKLLKTLKANENE